MVVAIHLNLDLIQIQIQNIFVNRPYKGLGNPFELGQHEDSDSPGGAT